MKTTKLELYFTDDEIIEFLKRKGYSLKEIQTVEYINVYHNKTIPYYHTRMLAYKDISDTDIENFVKDHQDHEIIMKYGIHFNFRKEIKNHLLSI